MTRNRINPLEELRLEKEIVRREVAESENRLAGHWDYLSDNAMPLILNSVIHGVAAMFGFGRRKEQKDTRETEESVGSSGFIQNVFNGVMAYYPLIWEIAQPMLIRFFVNKIKSLFTRKKKKRKNDDD